MKLASTSCCRFVLKASFACVRKSSIHFVWIVIAAYLSRTGCVLDMDHHEKTQILDNIASIRTLLQKLKVKVNPMGIIMGDD